MTAHLMATVWSLASHGFGHGNGNGLVGAFLRSIVHAIGWRTGTGIFHALGPAALPIFVIVAVVLWLRSRRTNRGGRRR